MASCIAWRRPVWKVRTALSGTSSSPIANENTLESLVKEAQVTGDAYRQQLQGLVRKLYGHHYRRMLRALLGALTFDSANPAMLQALALLRRFDESKVRYFPINEEIPLELLSATWRSAAVYDDDHASTRHRSDDDHASTRHRIGTRPGRSRSVLISIPRRSVQRDILLLIAAEIDANNGKPVFLSRREIATKANVRINTVKISLEKLMRKGLVATSEPDYSPKAGGALYAIPKEACRVLRDQLQSALDKHNQASEMEANQASEVPLVSSSFIKPTTNYVSSESMACRDVVVRLDLDERFKISANDLLDAYHAVGLTIQQFIESVEHGSHYMEGASRKATVKHPKAFFISRLRSRYIEPEPDFVPFAIQQELAIARAAKMRVELHQAAEKERFEAEFVEYLSNTADGDLRKILARTASGQLHRDTPRSPGALSVLRSHFARETNRPHLFNDDPYMMSEAGE